MEVGSASQLEVDIPRHKQLRYITFYSVELKTPQGHEWSVDKRYNDFYHLNESLKSKAFASLPLLPPKTFFPVRDAKQLQRRKEDLANYLRALTAREDILNSKEMVRFLEIDSHASEVLHRAPKLVEQIDTST